jgi:predicted metal-dependent hydrolase
MKDAGEVKMTRDTVLSVSEPKIILSQRRSLSIEVNPDLRVVVRAPIKMSQSKINKFILSKQSWIDEKLRYFRQNPQIAQERNITEEDRRFYMLPENKDFLNDVFSKIFQQMFAVHNVDANANNNMQKPKLSLRIMKTRWGSCSADGKRISLNLRLIAKPIELVEYVCIHECAHLVHHNHSKQFWSLVEKYCPNYRKIRKSL